MTQRSNVRLRSNVLCTRIADETGRQLASRGPSEIRVCLSYSELRALKWAKPFLYPSAWLEHDQLTPRQRINHRAFLADYREPPWNAALDGFQPVFAIDWLDEDKAHEAKLK